MVCGGGFQKIFKQINYFFKNTVWEIGIKTWGKKILNFITQQLWPSTQNFFNDNFSEASKIKAFFIKFKDVPRYFKSFWTGIKYLYQNPDLIETIWPEITWERLTTLNQWIQGSNASVTEFWDSLKSLKEISEKETDLKKKESENPLGKDFMNGVVKSLLKDPTKTSAAFKNYSDLKTNSPFFNGCLGPEHLELKDLKESFDQDDSKKYLQRTILKNFGTQAKTNNYGEDCKDSSSSISDFQNNWQLLKTKAEEETDLKKKESEDPMSEDFLDEVIESLSKDSTKTAKTVERYSQLKYISGYTNEMRKLLKLIDLKNAFTQDNYRSYLSQQSIKRYLGHIR